MIGRSLRCPEAFAVIFDRHAASVGRYLERRVGREVAQDLVAETFLAAFKGPRRVRPGAGGGPAVAVRDRDQAAGAVLAG